MAKVSEAARILSFNPRGSKFKLFLLFGQWFPRYGPIFKLAIFGHEIWHVANVPEVADVPSFYPKGRGRILGYFCAMGRRGWIRLIVSFQPLKVISLTASWIRWCMQVYACELMWTDFVWAERSSPDSFLVPSHRFNSATVEQKGITQTIYKDSEPPSRLPYSLMPSAKLRSANLPLFSLWCDAVGDRTPASRTLSGCSNLCATQGRSLYGQRLPRYRPIFKIAIFGHESWSSAKFPVFAHSFTLLLLHGVKIRLIFALRAVVSEIRARFSKLPYLGMKLCQSPKITNYLQ